MSREKTEQEVQTEKEGKTAVVLGIANLLTAPLYWLDTRLGVAASLVVTGAVLNQANDLGKEARPVANTANRAKTLFGAGDSLENTKKNVSEGGARIYDSFSKGF